MDCAKPVKTRKFMKISVFSQKMSILDISMGFLRHFWTLFSVLTVLTTFRHHGPDSRTGVSKTPIQSLWKCLKLTKIHEKLVENVTF